MVRHGERIRADSGVASPVHVRRKIGSQGRFVAVIGSRACRVDPHPAACGPSVRTHRRLHSLSPGDKFITERGELDAIKAEFPEGLAVDMESAAIAQVCHLYRVPFISFRIISDTPGADAHWQQYENFWETMADRSFGVVRTFLESLPSSLS